MAPMSEQESLALQRKDLVAHGATISALVDRVGRIELERAVEAERERNINDRLGRIEKSIEGLYGVGRWLLAVVAAGFFATFLPFLFGGGFNVPPG